MVSLYRAWAACGGAALGALGAPDALVHAGGVRFAAHCRLLAAHSGYFKSVLPPVEDPKRAVAESDSSVRYDGASRSDQTLRPSEETVVHIPNISAQQFWPLLAYMYTGYLELSPENIYQVLLATHLLHMPRALELCRSFLAQGRPGPPQAPATVVVKPIASRKLPPYLPPPASYRPMYANDTLIPSSFMRPTHDTPFRPMERLLPLHFAAGPEDSNSQILSTNTELNVGEESVAANAPVSNRNEAKEAAENLRRENKNVTDSEDSRSSLDVMTTPDPKDATNDLSVLLKNKTKSRPLKATVIIPKPSVSSQDTKEKDAAKVALSIVEDKIVTDVACCDGPVRFHRVLNAAYSGSGENRQDASDSEDSYVEIEEDAGSPYDNCNAFSRSLQKQMSEDIRTMKRDENRPGREGEEPARCPAETVYACVYCNHTFKSQYCYQKHARRHLNPVSIDAVNRGTPDASSETCCKARKLAGGKTPAVPGPRREVRLLDMNVQYYPCKTCGSKFPSYYFVHKHRKMCHAEEMDGGETAAKPPVGAEKKTKPSTSGSEGGEVGVAVREIAEAPEERSLVTEVQE